MAQKREGGTGRHRCEWCGTDPLYVDYHDREWGAPERSPLKLFEFLLLEGAQAGLSWITILRKRENYRRLFADFNPAVIARFDERKKRSLLADPAVVRNRLKVESAISNARIFVDLEESGRSFSELVWSFVEDRPVQNRWRTLQEIPAETEVSRRMAKELKRLGFRFVGSTICYAYMQAMGLVNDHVTSCYRHAECRALASD